MNTACILAVDDEPVSLEALTANLRAEGYETVGAATGEEAWALVSAAPERFDVILLDRMMPDIDGIEILRRIKAEAQFAHTPVVMQTSMTAAADIAAGLRAGAYYYLTKPFAADTLLAIVAAAVADRRDQLALLREVGQAARTLAYLKKAEFLFRSPAQARDIATLVANAAPDPGRIVLGLSELMLNAIEHGNLGIGYEEKSRLMREDRLAEEVARRLALPAAIDKQAVLEFERTATELRFLIRDRGAGFEWQHYLEISPQRAFDLHGRGIAMAKMISFDRVEYRGCGNEVLAVVAV